MSGRRKHLALITTMATVSLICAGSPSFAAPPAVIPPLPTLQPSRTSAERLMPPVPTNAPMKRDRSISVVTAWNHTDDSPSQAIDRPIDEITFWPSRHKINAGTNTSGELRVAQSQKTKTWVSPRAMHQTLFFNDNPLERDGKTNHKHLQSAVSALRFTFDALLSPLRSLRTPPSLLHYSRSPR